MTRLSSPIQSMQDHYTVVVIGSGYGGGIAASRLARAGQKVCLLERGREIRPGEYPANELEAAEEMQLNTPDGRIGSRLGMFDFHVNKSINAVVGCGLGGTSLINANVSLKAVPGVWADPRWPAQVIADLPTLVEDGYQAAWEMLRPTPYPDDYPPIAKLEALGSCAESTGDGKSFYRPPINVTFRDGLSPAGVPQKACINCGDCVSGCNHWAKNTTLMNYLPDAWNHGAEIFTEVSVRSLERRDDGVWIVHYELLGEGRNVFKAPDLFVTADVVIVSAGTLGSSEILLRSKQNGLPLSDQVGAHFSGNGDVLAFAFDTDRPIHGIGFGNHKPGELPPVGPCITGIIDLRHTQDVRQGFVIEEGSIPGALAPLLPASFAALGHLEGVQMADSRTARLVERLKAAESLFLGSYRGAIDNTQTYLVMAHDGSEGQLMLVDDRLRIDWPEVGKEAIFQTVNDKLEQISECLGGVFVKDPIWTKPLDDSLISVHPLGGCCMGEDARSGVVNHKGQVFSGAAGDAVYDNLYVTDGSIVPLSLGVNPLLTISALSERNMTLLCQDRGWALDRALPSQPRQVAASTSVPGIKFTETMKGYFSTVVKDDYQRASDQGKQAGSAMQFTLTIQSDDLNALIEKPDHKATIIGTVSSRALSAEPLTATGTFNLFVENVQEVDVRNMVYRMKLDSVEGKSYYFHGFKKVDDSCVTQLWPQTTTLYVTVYDGADDSAPVLGQGILHIEPLDFAKQMTTMKVINAPDLKTQVEAMARFGVYFAGVLFEAYGGVFVPDKYFNPDAPPRTKRPLRAGAPEVHYFTTSDGVDLRLTRYQGGTRGPVLLVHGAGVSSGIFSTDLPETNLLEYLYANQYDVWLFDFRVSIALPASQQQSNGDQIASIDHPEAVALIRKITGAETIQAVVHCYGSNTFFMSMLAGLEGVRSVVCSQVASNLLGGTANDIKSGLHLPQLLGALGVDSLTAYTASNSGWKSHLFDTVLKFAPEPKGEDCRNPVCHRISFMYSLLYQHEQLGERIHNNVHELFGVGNITTFEHLALMVRDKQVMSHDGKDVYMPHLDRLAKPIRFIHGAENRCYVPDSTKVTYDLLCAKNGAELYDRHVIPGYGHIDCIFGENAARDIYPLILEHLEKTQQV